MTSPEACGDLSSFNAWINSLGACGDLPRSAWITSLRVCGSPPLERVEHLVDRLPWSAWIIFLERVDGRPWSAWITSLRAHGWPPSEPRSVWMCPGRHTDGLAPSITVRLPGVVAQRVHAAAGTCITDEHKARGRQRAGATQRGATTSVSSLFQCFVGLCVRFLKPKLFSAPNYFNE
jgi:hypothetical protein